MLGLLKQLFMFLSLWGQMNDPRRIASLIDDAAVRYDLDRNIVAAIIFQESRGNIWAIRYEPKFYERHLAHKKREDLSGYVPKGTPTLRTEKTSRATSFGLMQIMGETARWRGFRARYLSALLKPSTNINFGCKYLRYLLNLSNAATKEEQYQAALQKYNGSSAYPKIILRIIADKQFEKILYPERLEV